MKRYKQVEILYIADLNVKEASDKINKALEDLECDPDDVRINYLNGSDIGSDMRVTYCVITYIKGKKKDSLMSPPKAVEPDIFESLQKTEVTEQFLQSSTENLTKYYGDHVFHKEFNDLDFSEVNNYFDPYKQAYVKIGDKVIAV